MTQVRYIGTEPSVRILANPVAMRWVQFPRDQPVDVSDFDDSVRLMLARHPMFADDETDKTSADLAQEMPPPKKGRRRRKRTSGEKLADSMGNWE